MLQRQVNDGLLGPVARDGVHAAGAKELEGEGVGIRASASEEATDCCANCREGEHTGYVFHGRYKIVKCGVTGVGYGTHHHCEQWEARR